MNGIDYIEEDRVGERLCCTKRDDGLFGEDMLLEF